MRVLNIISNVKWNESPIALYVVFITHFHHPHPYQIHQSWLGFLPQTLSHQVHGPPYASCEPETKMFLSKMYKKLKYWTQQIELILFTVHLDVFVLFFQSTKKILAVRVRAYYGHIFLLQGDTPDRARAIGKAVCKVLNTVTLAELHI